MHSGRNANEDRLEQGLMSNDQTQENSSGPINFYKMIIPTIFSASIIGLSVNFIIQGKYPFESKNTIQESLSALLIAVCGTLATFSAIESCRRNYPSLFRKLEETQDTQNILTGIKVTYDDQEYLVKAIQNGDQETYQIAIKPSRTRDDFSTDDEQPITLKIKNEDAKEITTIEGVLALWNKQNGTNYRVDSLMEDLLSMLPQPNPLIN